MLLCPACYSEYRTWDQVADHMSGLATMSESAHVMWLNRNLSKEELSKNELGQRLSEMFSNEGSLLEWARNAVIRKIYSGPHPLILAMQKPTKEDLLGYVIEHQHFLKNWVRVLSSVIERTDRNDVIKYELENITTEFLGCSGPSHFELLMRMGESLGMRKEEIQSIGPLPSTTKAIGEWREISFKMGWQETMGAMHSLELIADRGISSYGAKMHYFNVKILSSNDYPKEVKRFLGEGYSADTYHSSEALSLVEKYAGSRQSVQVAIIKSLDAVSSYFNARLERAAMLR
ncbi:MAG: C2H2 type zinc finger domain-containing protein [Conexivisphaerales archaeon]